MKPTFAQRALRRARLAAASLAFLLFLLAAAGLAGMLAHRLHARWALAAADGFVKAQAGPAILRAAASGAVAAALVHAAVALLFGRVFCGALCPLGLWQDVVGRAARALRRKRPAREAAAAFARRSGVERATRCLAAGLCFGALAAGFAVGFRALEPYSIAWRGAHAATHGGAALFGALAPLAAVTALAAWRGRLFCTALCPVGAALGLLSKAAPFRIRMNAACVKCGACAGVCPSHCIDVESGTVDNGRCTRCLACVAACKVRGIAFAAPRRESDPAMNRRDRRTDGRAQNEPAFSASRRAFLKGAAALAAGLAAGAALAKTGAGRLAAAARRALGILPPGADDPARFASRCTACLRCVGVCPSGILRPAEDGAGPVRIDLSAGACAFDCHRCAEACPTGAIRRMPIAEKQRTRIARLEFHPTHCIVFQGESHFCGRCAEACPTGAIELRRNGTPKVAHPDRCIGCGACQLACPGMHADDDPEGVVRKAMRIVPLERQC